MKDDNCLKRSGAVLEMGFLFFGFFGMDLGPI